MYLITGAAGFIGSNIVKALNDQGVENILAVDDLTESERFRNLRDLRIADYMDLRELRRALTVGSLDKHITAICHQGACADTMETDGRYMMDNNFTFSKDLLHAALRWRAPFVYASSASVYGAGREFRAEPACERPLNVYGYSKLLFDQYVRRFALGAGGGKSTVVGLRYFNVYGPREAHKGRMASMVYQLYTQLRETGVARLFEGTDGYADGEQRRDFIFVGDAARVNLFFLQQQDKRAGVFNLGARDSRSFNEVAHCLINHLGRGRIEYIPFPPALRGKYQSYTQAEMPALRCAGYKTPMTDLETGIAASMPHWEAERSWADEPTGSALS